MNESHPMRLLRKGSGGANWAGLRRLSQILFLALFLWLLLRTDSGGVNLFLQADPLAAAVNALATGALYRGLLWSLAILIPTLFLGRFFCGWICPLGTLNHFFGSLRSESKRGKRLLDSNRYKGIGQAGGRMRCVPGSGEASRPRRGAGWNGYIGGMVTLLHRLSQSRVRARITSEYGTGWV